MHYRAGLASSARMICGVTIISNSLLDFPCCGTLPRMMVCPSGIVTVVCTMAVSIRGVRMTLSPATEIGMPSFSGPNWDCSASSSITIVPSGVMRGVTPRISPTFSRTVVFA